MTSETKTMIELSDVAGIEVECRECKAKIIYPIEKSHDRISQQCPNCNETLFVFSRTAGGEGSVSLEQGENTDAGREIPGAPRS